MDTYIHYRLAANGGMFLLMIINTVQMTISMETLLPHHPELNKFYSLGFRYLTIWNAMVQMSYMALAFVCDYYKLQNKEEKIPVSIRKFRQKVFFEIVFPLCMSLAPFWPVYAYDRELILPIVTEIVVSKWQNIIFHGIVFVHVIWEMVFLPSQPKRSEIKIKPIAILHVIYIFNVLFSKYIHPGAWMYEILHDLDGSFWFFPIFFQPVTCALVSYHAQWWLRDILCTLRDTKFKLKV